MKMSGIIFLSLSTVALFSPIICIVPELWNSVNIILLNVKENTGILSFRVSTVMCLLFNASSITCIHTLET